MQIWLLYSLSNNFSFDSKISLIEKESFSVSEKECLDKAIKECKNASFEELMQRSHTNAWLKAFNSPKKRISEIDMARDAGANEEMIEYIKEELAWS